SLNIPGCGAGNRSSSSQPSAPTATHTLSLHDALPILPPARRFAFTELPRRFILSETFQVAQDDRRPQPLRQPLQLLVEQTAQLRSEEHTSELQSLTNLVCRLLLEEKQH